MTGFVRVVSFATAVGLLTACSTDSATGVRPFTGPALSVVGHGEMTRRYMAEVWTRGNVAYTSTWGARSLNGVAAVGNVVHIWRIDGATPVLADSLVIENATTTGDLQVSDDGKSFSAAAAVTITDAAGAVLAKGCATEEGRRIEL